jgi:hypothetical protein
LYKERGRVYLSGTGNRSDGPRGDGACGDSGGNDADRDATYVFDMGDDWTHVCEVLGVDANPEEEYGIVPEAPVSIDGWGWIRISMAVKPGWRTNEGTARSYQL